MRRKFSIFDTLGVSTRDDLDTIRQAWRRKVKTLHPDLAKDHDKSAASEALMTVNAAFVALRDHKPFADRRAANRVSDRRTRGPRKRVWTKAERQSVALKQAHERREQRARTAARPQRTPQKKRKTSFFAAQERAKQADIARRNAAALAQKEDAARAARAAKRAKAAEELRVSTARKNAEAARKARSNMANATQAQKAALQGYSKSLNAVSAETRRPKSVCVGLLR